MKKLKSRILYHGGTLPIPAYFQKGHLVFEKNVLTINAKAKDRRFDIDVRIPMERLASVTAAEKKYYSSTAYMLEIHYRNEANKEERLEIEIRSFGRRGRAQAISRNWANILNGETIDD
ncbi:MAG: hypothetical protein RBT11_05445 [Desulfobacterales bacterium]|jgi:hypothetical protein|nr:hypothetical protein [Desulfobacterales bacterium]